MSVPSLHMTVQGMQQKSHSVPQGSQLTQPCLMPLGLMMELVLLPEETEAGLVPFVGAMKVVVAITAKLTLALVLEVA